MKPLAQLAADVYNQMHQSAQLHSRDNFLPTPAHFMRMLRTFEVLVCTRGVEIAAAAQRYLMGVDALDETTKAVKQMEEDLRALQPKLIESQREVVEVCTHPCTTLCKLMQFDAGDGAS